MTADRIAAAVKAAVEGVAPMGPRALLDEVNRNLEYEEITVGENVVIAGITDVGQPAQTPFWIAINTWDQDQDPKWAAGTVAGSAERRARIHERLGLSESARLKIDAEFPIETFGAGIVDANWEPWYNTARQGSHDFYWKHYKKVLEENNFDGHAIASIDEMTNRIVGRLADPTSAAPYQSKGLVVGYVQSGKTANFTGVMAKAIDSGYRLIIVLTGTYDNLRTQTQRRLDKELVGWENIVGGIPLEDDVLAQQIDYVKSGDKEWTAGKFSKLGVNPVNAPGVPAIRRLTTSLTDYKLLGVINSTVLDFQIEKAAKQKPLWDSQNLHDTAVRLAVVKKNSTVLRKLNADLAALHIDLNEIPALILDDESDLASINTIRPGKGSAEEVERTAVNKEIVKLLKVMPRAQYLGYTATPAANVFVNPDVEEDIFPKDFMFSLEPSREYMGGAAMHDLDAEPTLDKADPAVSNEAAFVRDLGLNAQLDEDDELADAIDAWVLTGGIKLWRQANSTFKFRHHTMLVHESVSQKDHALLAARIDAIWGRSGFKTALGKQRLKRKWETDILPVWRSRNTRDFEDLPMPDHFAALVPFIGEAIGRMEDTGSPVVVVNGDKDSDYEKLDFQAKDTWRILVGGAKLSRGFTVEDLTISYFRRKSEAADTLMQMGRWFGYRRGYRDLVRLYIDRYVVDAKGKTFDLYRAFEGSMEDELLLRRQLRRFEGVNADGKPKITPRQIPALIFQALPWLRPVAPNKRHNAVLKHIGEGGIPIERTWYPRRDTDPNPARIAAVTHLLSGAGQQIPFHDADGKLIWPATCWLVDAQLVVDALVDFVMPIGHGIEEHLAFMSLLIAEKKLTEFVVMIPETGGASFRKVAELELPVRAITRRTDRPAFSGKLTRREEPFKAIAGHPEAEGTVEAQALAGDGTRGVLALFFTYDPVDSNAVPSGRNKGKEPLAALPPELPAEDVATVFSFTVPYAAAPEARSAWIWRDVGGLATVQPAAKTD
ncbi:Z1 domain-containing protein [Salinibacterium sp. NG253]|uniref:Z1 domain-containing protein n=1 Tax=Salinibacterium sp. NG253 TaxID=2792039 RepID=UPI0018CEBD1F|nr:Z1 domain-containing protein [Salinibacterium sp. NG253]MBH0116995.1 Z1 domain-containing protein [Salinibacterium sp. NG253]